jgi:hypothetical protein
MGESGNVTGGTGGRGKHLTAKDAKKRAKGAMKNGSELPEKS